MMLALKKVKEGEWDVTAFWGPKMLENYTENVSGIVVGTVRRDCDNDLHFRWLNEPATDEPRPRVEKTRSAEQLVDRIKENLFVAFT